MHIENVQVFLPLHLSHPLTTYLNMEHLNNLRVVSYSIADLRIDIELERNLLHFIPKSFTPFHISQEIPTNMHLSVSLSEKIEDDLGIKILTSFDCAIGKVNCYRKESHMKFLIIRDGIKIGSIQMNDDASKTKLEIFISELANELISFTVMLMYSSYTSASSFRILNRHTRFSNSKGRAGLCILWEKRYWEKHTD